MYLHPSSPSVRCFNERNKHRPPLYLFCQLATKPIQSIKIRYKKGKSTTNIQASPLPPLVSSHHPGNSTHTHTPHTPRTPMLLAPSPFRYGISVKSVPKIWTCAHSITAPTTHAKVPIIRPKPAPLPTNLSAALLLSAVDVALPVSEPPLIVAVGITEVVMLIS